MLQNRILKNTFWIIIGNGLTAAGVFVASAIVANRLSVEEFGFFQLVYTYFIFIQAFEYLAHPNVVKDLFHSNPEERSIIVHSVTLIIVSIFGIACLGLLTAGFFFTEARWAWILMLLMFGQVFKSSLGLAYFFDYTHSSKNTQIGQVVGNGVGSFFRSSIVFLNRSLNLQAAGFLIANCVSSLCWLFFARKWFRPLEIFKAFTSVKGMAKKIFLSSIPLWLLSLLHLILFKIDLILLGALGSTSDVAVYSNAVRLTEPWSFVAGAIATSFFPTFLSARKNSIRAYYQKVGLYFRILFLMSFVLALGLSVCAGPIITFLYGAKYIESAQVLRFHAFNLIPFFLVVGLQVFDVLENFKRFSVFKFVVSALVAIALNVILIPKLGIYACVISSFVSYLMLSILLNVADKRMWLFTLLVFKSFLKVTDDLKWLKQRF